VGTMTRAVSIVGRAVMSGLSLVVYVHTSNYVTILMLRICYK